MVNRAEAVCVRELQEEEEGLREELPLPEAHAEGLVLALAARDAREEGDSETVTEGEGLARALREAVVEEDTQAEMLGECDALRESLPEPENEAMGVEACVTLAL